MDRIILRISFGSGGSSVKIDCDTEFLYSICLKIRALLVLTVLNICNPISAKYLLNFSEISDGFLMTSFSSTNLRG